MSSENLQISILYGVAKIIDGHWHVLMLRQAELARQQVTNLQPSPVTSRGATLNAVQKWSANKKGERLRRRGDCQQESTQKARKQW